MKDIFKTYNKQKKISNIWIIVTSLALAIWVNFFVIDGSNLWDTMKANVLEVKTQNELADIYPEINGNFIDIYANQNMNNVKNIAISFSYNPNNVWVLSINSIDEIIALSYEKWIQSLLVNYSEQTDILAWDKILTIETIKHKSQSEQLNIFNANFTDLSGENYLLSTSGITF